MYIMLSRQVHTALRMWICNRVRPFAVFSLNAAGQKFGPTKTVQLISKDFARMSHFESLQNRGVYNTFAYRGNESILLQDTKIEKDGRTVECVWDDGTTSRFHSIWLRHMCHCPSCRVSYTGQVNVNFDNRDVTTAVECVEKEGETVLTVKWKGETDHLGVFPVPFLKTNSYSGNSLCEKKEQMKMVYHKDGKIPEVQFSDVMDNDLGLYSWLRDLNEYGICLVKNVPTEEGMVRKVTERIAPIQKSIYGEVFDVKDKIRPTNAAYTSGKLELHQDQPMYESAPGLQFLHTLRFDDEVIGGDNVFVDVFYVAEEFRKNHPEDFEVLTRVAPTWETVQYSEGLKVHMAYKRPHFILNESGELISVTWHPHLVGPLQAKEEDVLPYYRAYAKLSDAVNNCPVRFNLRMCPGDMISFNNRRMLHGREAYDSQGGYRWLQGTYVEIDEYKSRLQVLSNQIGDGKIATRVGNGDMQ